MQRKRSLGCARGDWGGQSDIRRAKGGPEVGVPGFLSCGFYLLLLFFEGRRWSVFMSCEHDSVGIEMATMLREAIIGELRP